MLKELCDHRDLHSRAGLQTMLGCAVRNGEWEVSMYLNSEAYAPERFTITDDSENKLPNLAGESTGY